MRDAIIYSNWTWEVYNVPERISLALAQLGCKVLYCEPPVSVFRSRPLSLRSVSADVSVLKLKFVSSRFSRLPGAARFQANWMRKQIATAARQLGLSDPIFLHTSMDGIMFPLLRLMGRHHYSVHICMDHVVGVYPKYDRFVEIADKTLAIPKTSYHSFRAKFGDKVEAIRQSVDFLGLTAEAARQKSEPADLLGVPRPRLVYMGAPNRRLNIRVTASVLRSHPGWHFISGAAEKGLEFPNVHVLPRVRPEALGGYLRFMDVGFMPYDCHNELWLHCVPLKLFEYFALGMPVVSTPIVHLWEYKDLIYFGDTAEELARAIEDALRESPDSPKRGARIEIARKHSLENLAAELGECLPLQAAISEPAQAFSVA